MSVSKPFVFALVCEALGPEQAREKLGVNSTGLPFNSLEAVERSRDGRTNPMVNSGAIATTSLVPGARAERSGRPSTTACRASPAASSRSTRRSTARRRRRTSATRRSPRVLDGFGRIYCDPAEAIDLYTRQCSLNVSARDLAVMGATLADGGVNPLTRRARRRPATSAAHTLAVMTTAGLYETSGDWLYDVGLPGKSGIGGGIVTVSPGQGRARHVRAARSTRRATASRASSPRASSRGSSASTCSPRSRRQ